MTSAGCAGVGASLPAGLVVAGDAADHPGGARAARGRAGRQHAAPLLQPRLHKVRLWVCQPKRPVGVLPPRFCLLALVLRFAVGGHAPAVMRRLFIGAMVYTHYRLAIQALDVLYFWPSNTDPVLARAVLARNFSSTSPAVILQVSARGTSVGAPRQGQGRTSPTRVRWPTARRASGSCRFSVSALPLVCRPALPPSRGRAHTGARTPAPPPGVRTLQLLPRQPGQAPAQRQPRLLACPQLRSAFSASGLRSAHEGHPPYADAQRLGRVQTPVMVIIGEKDKMCPWKASGAVAVLSAGWPLSPKLRRKGGQGGRGRARQGVWRCGAERVQLLRSRACRARRGSLRCLARRTSSSWCWARALATARTTGTLTSSWWAPRAHFVMAASFGVPISRPRGGARRLRPCRVRAAAQGKRAPTEVFPQLTAWFERHDCLLSSSTGALHARAGGSSGVSGGGPEAAGGQDAPAALPHITASACQAPCMLVDASTGAPASGGGGCDCAECTAAAPPTACLFASRL